MIENKVISLLCLGDDTKHYAISVVIPTYKAVDSLITLVTSVCEQKVHGFEYNIVIVDNSDMYVEQLKEKLYSLQKQYKRDIVYYQNEANIGMFNNWNRVVELANCEYACMMHSDDYVIQGCLQHMYDSLQKLPKEVALYVDRYVINTQAELIKEPSRRVLPKKVNKLYSFLSSEQHYIHKVKPIDIVAAIPPVAPSGLVINKKLFTKLGGWISISTGWPADTDFALRIAKTGSLYCSDYKYLCKREDQDKYASAMNVAIPIIYISTYLYEDAIKHTCVPFKDYLIRNHSISTMQCYGIDYKYIKPLIPACYFSKWNKFLYGIYKKILLLNHMLR